MKVRLKPITPLKFSRMKSCFNSMKVRLKPKKRAYRDMNGKVSIP